MRSGSPFCKTRDTVARVSNEPVFRPEQMERGAELGIGVAGPNRGEILTTVSAAS